MTQPFPPPKPSTANVDYGPNPSAVTEDPKPPPATPKPKPTSKPLGGLGTNRKARSTARRLTRPDSDTLKEDELSDYERVVLLYQWLAKIAHALKQTKLSTALDECAESCTEAWFNLAETNDKVRGYILAFIEGNEWAKLAAAHAPILMAVIPEKVLERLLFRMTAMFRPTMPSDEDIERMIREENQE